MEDSMKKILLIIALILFRISVIYGQSDLVDPSGIKFTILYNDKALDDSFIGDQGFSCLIEIEGKLYLFDAGNDEEILKKNTEKLKIDCSKIEFIYISHLHTDHICGLSGIINKCKNPVLYLPSEFPKTQTPKAKGYVDKTLADADSIVSETIFIKEFTKIGDHFYSTGGMEEKTYEQALVINTSKGLIILVGCSHPGITEIVKRAKSQLNKDVYFVMGGFHLDGTRDPEKIKNIAAQLKDLTKYIAAGHCNDEKAQEFFKSAFGEKFIDMKAGLSFKLSDYEHK
jgi:7,8-dihydropterin-6-yl-methyl-4-(beta-D-ribofuranosyl)aminobenzene 5'-phosphate synthase